MSGDRKIFGLFPRETPVAKYRYFVQHHMNSYQAFFDSSDCIELRVVQIWIQSVGEFEVKLVQPKGERFACRRNGPSTVNGIQRDPVLCFQVVVISMFQLQNSVTILSVKAAVAALDDASYVRMAAKRNSDDRQEFMHAQFEFKPEYEKLAGYFNFDYGTGRIRGVYLQGNDAVRPIFHAWPEPFKDLGATTLSIANIGATDHVSFDQIGCRASSSPGTIWKGTTRARHILIWIRMTTRWKRI